MSGEYWDNIPDFLLGQAPNKISYLLRLVDFDFIMHSLPGEKLAIVDIGCGAGKVSSGLAEILCERYPDVTITVHGYDLSPQAIEIATRENNKGEFVCGDFQDAGRTWDLALLCDIIEHVEEPDAFLRSVAERSRFFVVGFAMDDNLANRLDKRRRKRVVESGHINLFHENRARAFGEKYGKVLASGYIPNPMARNLKIRSVRGGFTLPFRVAGQLLSRRLKGKFFGGESIYFFAQSRLFSSINNSSISNQAEK